jgi:hypothetical protein
MTWTVLELNPELSVFSIEIILSYFTIYLVIKRGFNDSKLYCSVPPGGGSAYIS